MSDGWRDTIAPSGDAWESLPPGPDLARALAAIDPHSLPDELRVSYLAAAHRLSGWTHMVESCALLAVSDAVEAATSSGPGTYSSYQASCVADEIAAALHIAPRTATAKVSGAEALVRQWPVLGRRVAEGALTVAQARVIAEGVAVLASDDVDDDRADSAIRGILRFACHLPPARLRERVARVVASIDPESAAKRRRRAARELTDVSLWREDDGMACLAVRGPAPDILGLRDVIQARAEAMSAYAAPHDDRTAGQWRLAAFLAAFGLAPVGMPVVESPTAPTGAACAPGWLGPGSVRAEIRVVIDWDTLFGLSHNPGELEGYGPLDADLARALAADGEWVRWVTDPVGDFLIDEGRRRFPGARLARFLRSRESRCKHPGCGVRSSNCDADHLPGYSEGGATAARDMSPTCPRHNRHRGPGGWRIDTDVDLPRDPHGPPDPTWVSPLGRRYETLTPRVLHNDFIPRRT